MPELLLYVMLAHLLQGSVLVDVHPVHCGGHPLCGALLTGVCSLSRIAVSIKYWVCAVFCYCNTAYNLPQHQPASRY
jgi:hypothetical protein